MNKLYYGDNLEVLRKYVRDETIDLCYIDPPFNSKRNYNQIYNNIGREDTAQAQAFVDTWTWDAHALQCFEQVLDNVNGVQTRQSIELLRGLDKVLGRGSLLAYLASMTARIAEIHRTLKPTGSFYLHCDPSASHYLKLVCDALFCGDRGGEFKNEIVWKRTSAHSSAKRWGPIHDIILFYTKSQNFTWNKTYQAYSEKYVSEFYKHSENGKRYQLVDLTAPEVRNGDSGKPWRNINPTDKGRHWAVPNELLARFSDNWSSMTTQEKLDLLAANDLIYWTKNGKPRLKRFLDENAGVPIQDIIDDINPLSAHAAERLGYPTQKPETLLERIIAASSNERGGGSVILDAFCGCGTTIAVAQRMNRQWIGIDITYQSISLILKRLRETFGAAVSDAIQLHGIPRDRESVIALRDKKDDRVRKEFEKWAILTYSDNRAVINEKKGADKGIDGLAYLAVGRDSKGGLTTARIIFSVKSGKVSSAAVRDLRGVIERESAAGGILLTLEEPTAQMHQEARQAGLFKGEFTSFERLQIVTVQDILDGARLKLPMLSEVVKKADAQTQGVQHELF